MKVAVVYDISTMDAKGRSRLDKVRRICMKWGCPVQKSVYECNLDNAQLTELAMLLNQTIKPIWTRYVSMSWEIIITTE